MNANHIEQSYLESRVLSAGPVELIALLYEGALQAVRDARRALAGNEPMDRSRHVTRAVAILSELTRSLDHERGGALSLDLRELYGYIQSRLLQAHAAQSDKLLLEAQQLLADLHEPWAKLATVTTVDTASGCNQAYAAEAGSRLSVRSRSF